MPVSWRFLQGIVHGSGRRLRRVLPGSGSVHKILYFTSGEITPLDKDKRGDFLIVPDFALFNLTHACNNRCRWCYASPLGFKKENMITADVQDYLRLSKSLGIKDVGFLGGEPTMHPDLFGMIRSASNLGLRVYLYTNGRKMSDPDYVKKLKDSGVYIVQIGIQGADPEKHDRITRVKGSYAETLAGIKNCKKAGIKSRMLTVLCYKDFDVYKGIIDKFAGMNIHLVFFRETPKINRLSEQGVMSNRKTAELVEKLFRYSKKRGVAVSFYIRMPLCWFRKPLANEMMLDGAFENLCHVPDGNSLNIDVDGNLLPCVNWAGVHIFSLKEHGKTMSKREFLHKWNSKRLNRIRKKLRGYPSKECITCSQYGVYCRGGCPLIKFKLGPFHKEYQKP
jgi:radical SAM protein with 4Fe4S-binding SPASM domain